MKCVCGKHLISHCGNIYICSDQTNCKRIAMMIYMPIREADYLEFYILEKTK